MGLLNIFKSALLDKKSTGALLDPYYKNLVQFKHACLGDYGARGEATLHSCTCGYYKKYNLPCYHMYELALARGIFDELFRAGKFLDPAIDSLSKGAANTLAHNLYMGYYDEPRSFSTLKNKSFKKELLGSGLIVVDGENDGEFRFSADVQNNIFYVLYKFMQPINMEYHYNK